LTMFFRRYHSELGCGGVRAAGLRLTMLQKYETAK
jgi:hypothetical protein